MNYIAELLKKYGKNAVKKSAGIADDVSIGPVNTKSIDINPDELLNSQNSIPSGISDKVVEQISPQINQSVVKPTNKARNAAIGTAAVGAGIAGSGGDGENQEAKSMDPLMMAAAINAVPAAISAFRSPADTSSPKPEGVPQAQVPQQEATSQSPTEDQYLSMMKDAQSQQNEQNFIDNMLRAGITGGAAIAGTKADYSGVDALQKQNSKPVENVKGLMQADMDSKKLKKTTNDLDDETMLRDPNSDISKQLRDMLSKLGYPVNEKVTGKQLKDMGINVYNLIGQKEAREASRLNREAMMKNSNNERTKTAIEKRFQNIGSNKAFVAYNNTKDAISAFDYALASKDKEAVGTAFMKFAKSAQGDDSVVRSEDMKTLAGGTPFGNPKKMMDHYIALSQGKNFTTTELANMKKVMEVALKTKGQAVQQLMNPMLKKIETTGEPVDMFIDPGLVDEFKKYGPTTSGSTPQGETKTIGDKTYKKVAGGWEEL